MSMSEPWRTWPVSGLPVVHQSRCQQRDLPADSCISHILFSPRLSSPKCGGGQRSNSGSSKDDRSSHILHYLRCESEHPKNPVVVNDHWIGSAAITRFLKRLS